jgi:CRP-like cAMP-binding protein
MPLSLPAKTVLYKRHGRIDFVFFPLSGLISSVAGASERIEVGLIGREGMTGLSAVLGVDTSPHECFVQISGEAIRISAPELMQAFEAEADLRKHILLYAREFMLQIAGTALANGKYTIEERLARWLLLCRDRLDGDEIPLTHDFISLLMGVTRPGVTIALNTLERANLVRSARGRITILDRAKLEEIAGEAYAPRK